MTARTWQPCWWQWLPGISIIGLVVLAAWYISAHDNTGPWYGFSLIAGMAFGIFLQRSRFCFYCILKDFFEHRHINGLLGIMAALLTGTLGYHVVFTLFVPFPLDDVLPPGAHIGPVSLALVLAAFVFGLGMAFSGSCISAQLYRLGEGSLDALVVIPGVLAGFFLAFLSWNFLYLAMIQQAPVLWLPALAGYGGSLLIQFATMLVLVVLLVRNGRLVSAGPATTFTEALLGRLWPAHVGGILIGMLATLAYLRVAPLGVTAELGSIARTLGQDFAYFPERLEGLDSFRGCAAVVKDSLLSHNGLFVAGLIAGAFAVALIAGDFRAKLPALRALPRLFLGGVLMGWGAMTALGCTIGTLLSGIMAGAVSGWVFALFSGFGVFIGWLLRKRHA